MKSTYKFLMIFVLVGLAMASPLKPALAADAGETDPLLNPETTTTTTGTTTAATGTIAAQTCDTNVWQTMENRARMETEREIMQNQNLIFKADSVLNYVCMDKFAAHASANVGVLFTHTSYWSPMVFPWEGKNGAMGMPEAMQKVVIASMTKYRDSNFPDEYLGGRGRELSLPKPQITDIPKGSSSGSYECGVMSQVWNVAKCLNFLQTATAVDNDGFYPFKNLTGTAGGQNVDGYEKKNEVRQFPSPCSGTPISPAWAAITDQSRNKNDAVYPYTVPNNQAFTDVRNLIEPGKCDGAGVKTGVKIILAPGGPVGQDDGVCTNPGCTYKAGKCAAVTAATTGAAAP